MSFRASGPFSKETIYSSFYLDDQRISLLLYHTRSIVPFSCGPLKKEDRKRRRFLFFLVFSPLALDRRRSSRVLCIDRSAADKVAVPEREREHQLYILPSVKAMRRLWYFLKCHITWGDPFVVIVTWPWTDRTNPSSQRIFLLDWFAHNSLGWLCHDVAGQNDDIDWASTDETCIINSVVSFILSSVREMDRCLLLLSTRIWRKRPPIMSWWVRMGFDTCRGRD